MMKKSIIRNIISMMTVVIISLINASYSYCQLEGYKESKGDIFHKKITANENLYYLLSCVVQSKQIKTKESIMNKDLFLEIAAEYQEYYRENKNLDSFITKFINNHSEVDFISENAIRDLETFTDTYKTTINTIFSGIESDEDVGPMKILEEKLLKIRGLAKIYRLYIPEKRDLSTLSSTSGVALYIQIAYYIFSNNMENRKNILKQLL